MLTTFVIVAALGLLEVFHHHILTALESES
jgi:hypothetical protein